MSNVREERLQASDVILPHAVEVFPRHASHRIRLAIDDDRLGGIDFTSVKPVRSVSKYAGQKHKPVYVYLHGCHDLVLCESRLEARVLMELDFDGFIAAVAAQPFTLQYTLGGRPYQHTPDFALADAHGEVSIVDVKPVELLDKVKNQRDFRATAEWCERMGFRYQVLSDYTEPLASAIRYLAGYRTQPPSWHSQAPVVLSLLDLDGEGLELHELVHQSAQALQVPEPLVLPSIYCLMWHGYLSWDTSQELQMNLTVRKARLWTEGSR